MRAARTTGRGPLSLRAARTTGLRQTFPAGGWHDRAGGHFPRVRPARRSAGRLSPQAARTAERGTACAASGGKGGALWAGLPPSGVGHLSTPAHEPPAGHPTPGAGGATTSATREPNRPGAGAETHGRGPPGTGTRGRNRRRSRGPRRNRAGGRTLAQGWNRGQNRDRGQNRARGRNRDRGPGPEAGTDPAPGPWVDGVPAAGTLGRGSGVGTLGRGSRGSVAGG